MACRKNVYVAAPLGGVKTWIAPAWPPTWLQSVIEHSKMPLSWARVRLFGA